MVGIAVDWVLVAAVASMLVRCAPSLGRTAWATAGRIAEVAVSPSQENCPGGEAEGIRSGWEVATRE
jgi:hypothetical protein